MNHVKQRCLHAFSIPIGSGTIDDLTMQIVRRSDGTTTYYYGGEQFTENTSEATEANALAAKLMAESPGIPCKDPS